MNNINKIYNIIKDYRSEDNNGNGIDETENFSRMIASVNDKIISQQKKAQMKINLFWASKLPSLIKSN